MKTKKIDEKHSRLKIRALNAMLFSRANGFQRFPRVKRIKKGAKETTTTKRIAIVTYSTRFGIKLPKKKPASVTDKTHDTPPNTL